MPVIIPLSQEKRVQAFYLCSDCWEALHEIHFDTQRRSVVLACDTPDCPHRGMVSVQYVEERERKARLWLRNIRKALAQKSPEKKSSPKRTRAQLLAQLGY